MKEFDLTASVEELSQTSSVTYPDPGGGCAVTPSCSTPTCMVSCTPSCGCGSCEFQYGGENNK